MWHSRKVRAHCEYARVEKLLRDASVNNYSKQGQKEDSKETETKKQNRKWKRQHNCNRTAGTHLLEQRKSLHSCPILTKPTFFHVDSHQRTNIWKLQNGGLIFKTFKMAVNQQLTEKKEKRGVFHTSDGVCAQHMYTTSQGSKTHF